MLHIELPPFQPMNLEELQHLHFCSGDLAKCVDLAPPRRAGATALRAVMWAHPFLSISSTYYFSLSQTNKNQNRATPFAATWHNGGHSCGARTPRCHGNRKSKEGLGGWVGSEGQANLADARVEGTCARSVQACTLHNSGALPSSPAGACCSVSVAKCGHRAACCC